MIINGILSIDQMRDHVPSINLICTLIPRHILEMKYGIMIPKPEEGEDPNRSPFSEELLNAYACMRIFHIRFNIFFNDISKIFNNIIADNRGFMTANGQPDNSRAARYVLKDFVNGKLLYCYAPPNVNQEEFNIFEKEIGSNFNIPAKTLKIIKVNEFYLFETLSVFTFY